MELLFQSKQFNFKLPTEEDEDVYQKVYTNESLMKYVAEPLSDQQTKNLFLSHLTKWSFQSNRLLNYVIFSKKSGEKIGLCGVKTTEPYTKQGHIGVMLLSKYHSKGYGTEILVALSKHCFESLGYHKLLGPPAYNNNSSINMLQKAGYQQEAILRDNWILEGNYIDTPLYTLLEKDLEQRTTSE